MGLKTTLQGKKYKFEFAGLSQMMWWLHESLVILKVEFCVKTNCDGRLKDFEWLRIKRRNKNKVESVTQTKDLSAILFYFAFQGLKTFKLLIITGIVPTKLQ